MRLGGNCPALSVTVCASCEILTLVPSAVLPENSANVLELTVAVFSGFENVSTAVAFRPMLSEPSFGVTESTTGAVVSVAAPVVKELTKVLTMFPAVSCSGFSTTTWKKVLPGMGADGVKVTTAPFTVRVPARCRPAPCRNTVLELSVVASTGLLNVSTTLLVTGTAVAPLTGFTVSTWNAALSAIADALVVKVLVNGITGLPSASVKPWTATVYKVLAASRADGWKTMLRRSLLTVIVPGTGTPAAATVIALLVTVIGFTCVLICTLTCAFTGDPLAPAVGLTAMTCGAVVCVATPVINVLANVFSNCPARLEIPEERKSSY